MGMGGRGEDVTEESQQAVSHCEGSDIINQSSFLLFQTQEKMSKISKIKEHLMAFTFIIVLVRQKKRPSPQSKNFLTCSKVEKAKKCLNSWTGKGLPNTQGLRLILFI